MIRKLLKTLLISLLLFNISLVNVYAAKSHNYYSLDIDSINSDVKPYLQSVSIEEETKEVFINNKSVGYMTSDPQTFRLSDTGFNLNVTISLIGLSVSAEVSIPTKKNYTAAFKFEIEDNKYYVCTFYPDVSNMGINYSQQSTRNGDIHNFNFGYTYDNEYKSFNVQLVQSSGEVYVNNKRNGVLDKVSVPIVFEYIGSNFPITSIDYSAQLNRFSWTEASQSNRVFYNESDYSNVSVKQEYELSNEYLNLPSETRNYGAYVDEWIRVGGTSQSGTGVWQSTGNRIKVVCEYYEDNTCGNAIRSEFPRYWAIFPGDLSTNVVSKNTKLVDIITTVYKNWYYSPSAWVSQNEFDSSIAGVSTTAYQYSARNWIWSDYGSWTEMQPSQYSAYSGKPTSDLDYTSKQLYKKRTGSWGDWTAWATGQPQTQVDREIDIRTMYSERDGSWGAWSGWSTTQPQQDTGRQIDSYVEYSSYSWGTSKSGSYQSACQYYTNQTNYACGTNDTYTGWGNWATNKYGPFTDACDSRYGQNTECGYATCPASACGIESTSYSNWGGYRTSKYGGFQSQCTSRSGRNSECGTTTSNKTCTRYYCATSRTCTKKVLGICTSYSYSGYRYTYGSKPSPAYNCSSSSVTSSSCGTTTTTNSCTSYNCPQSASNTYKSCATVACGYKSCTSYSCPSSKSVENKTCNLWYCPQSAVTKYQYRDIVWGAWSGYTHTSCVSDTLTMCKSRTEYRYRDMVWGNWSSFEHETCTPNTYTKCQLSTNNFYKYRYKTFNDWSAWYNTTSAINPSYFMEVRYRYNTGSYKWEDFKGTSTKGEPYVAYHTGLAADKKQQTTQEWKEVAEVTSNKKTYPATGMNTYEDVENWQIQYAKEAAAKAYVESLKHISSGDEEESDVLWSDLEANLTSSIYYEAALRDIKGRNFYQPYLYFYGWRFLTANYNLPSGTVNGNEVTTTKKITFSSLGTLIFSSDPIERDTKVIYYDYRDPLANYKDNLPENWEGKELLIEAIKNSDLGSNKITIKISQSDLKAMKEWVMKNGSDPDGCSMLKEFSYIFDSETQARIASGACKAE